ncbi:MAG: mechanosensitive ion channel family protein [Planctomycetota bacterium]
MSTPLNSWFRYPVLGNPVWLWGAAGLLALAVLAALLALRRAVAARLEARSAGDPMSLRWVAAQVLRRTRIAFLVAMALLGGSLVLDLGERAAAFRRLLAAVALLQAGFWGGALLTGMLERWKQRRARDGSAATAIAATGFLGRVALWTAVFLLILDNFGVRVTALLAGLGVGGIAVALAVQNILGDLFASISIVLDRPFEIGDFIVVGDCLGTVEYIGLKTTRVRALSGEQIVFSNSDLLSSRIRNFKRMYERRVVFTIGVTYETPYEKLTAIPGMLRSIVEAQPNVRFDRAHFQRYGEYALVFEVVYFVQRPEYNVYMDVQQAINLEIYRRFAAEGIEFAYPTQTVLVQRRGAGVRPSVLAGPPPDGAEEKESVSPGRPGETPR